MINESFGQTLLVIVATAFILWALHQLLLGVYESQAPKRTGSKAKQRGSAKRVTKVAETVDVDDLTRIEGVGPKIAELLNDAGYNSFSDVRDAKVSDLRKILRSAGNRYKMHDAGSWPRQARLAANEEWDKLDKLQKRLKGGRS